MKFLLLAIVVVALVGCATTPKSFTGDYLTVLKSLPLGADKSKVVEQFGEPSLVENETDGSKWTYVVPYKSMQIPKVILWLNSDNKLTRKHINLFKESNDSMAVAQVENYLGKLQLISQDQLTEATHYISSNRIMEDREAGISIQVNEARDGEVVSIGWYSPVEPRRKVSGR